MPRSRRTPDRLDVAEGADSLPVVGRGAASSVKRSRMGRLRAAVLVGVHVLFLAHITHYVVRGRTLSPVEPSESMYTLELGEVNAGVIFFLLALASTAIAGRFFCGWGCHIVALQDACGWLMRRVGIRPRPFRSRLLLLLPAGLAFYMFGWPPVKRLLTAAANRTGLTESLQEAGIHDVIVELGLLYPQARSAFAGFSNHLVTDSFWKTFPTPLWAALTFVSCGFLAVYLLGSKGFCTYGCPYGALFVAADRLAPVRIVVNDRCDGCGHCTATCTSNVLVHEEVRRFGNVVDPGCMKCMDCIDVCPTDALSLGWARPAVLKGEPADDRAARRFRLGRRREWFVFAVAVAGTLCFRGHYDRFPLLMSVGLGAMTGFCAHLLLRLATEPDVRLQNHSLKRGGAWKGFGIGFAIVATAWLAFTADAGFVQWHRKWGGFWLERTEATREEVFSGLVARTEYTPRHDEAARRSRRHFELADRADPWGIAEVKLGRAWGHLLAGEVEAGGEQIRAALDLEPDNRGLWSDLVRVYAAHGRVDDAIATARARLERLPPTANAHLELAAVLIQSGRADELGDTLEAARALAGDDASAWFDLGMSWLYVGRPEPAADAFGRAAELEPERAEAHFRRGGALVGLGRLEEAAESLRRCVAVAPDAPEARFNLGAVLARLGRPDEALEHLERADSLAPYDPQTLLELGRVYEVLGRPGEALSLWRESIAGRGDLRGTLGPALRDLEGRLEP